MSQPIKQEQIDDGNDEEIRSIGSSEWTLQTASSDTIEDGNAQGNGINSINVLSEKSPAHRIPLPLELNCQIFECLKFGIQRKFIGELGRGIYGMFRQKVLTKSKRLRNPKQNGWNKSSTNAIFFSSNGLLASNNTWNWPNVFAKKGFQISGQLSRNDNFPGTILYYFEVTNMSLSRYIYVGLSSGNLPVDSYVGDLPNSYAIRERYDHYFLSGKPYPFEWPNGANKPKWNVKGDVIGCGLVLNSEKELSIFFTGNGILMGNQIPINSTVKTLYSTVKMFTYASVEANFGDNPAKPFKYNI